MTKSCALHLSRCSLPRHHQVSEHFVLITGHGRLCPRRQAVPSEHHHPSCVVKKPRAKGKATKPLPAWDFLGHCAPGR